MRNLFSIAILLSLMVPGAARASVDADASMPSDARIKLLMYDETDVYTINTRYGYQTNIVFAPNEEIETISVGDRSVWQIIPAGNRLFIRPMDENITTNMTIITNKHSYQFDLNSVSAEKAKGNIYVAKFVYKDEKKKQETPPEPPASAPVPPAASEPVATETKTTYVPVPSPFGYSPSVPSPGSAEKSDKPKTEPTVGAGQEHGDSTSPFNYNYTYSGSDDAAPLQVYDDAHSTFIKFRSLSDPSPSVTTVNADGTETAVPFTSKDNYLQVSTVAGELVVRKNDGTVHIFNENTNPR